MMQTVMSDIMSYGKIYLIACLMAGLSVSGCQKTEIGQEEGTADMKLVLTMDGAPAILSTKAEDANALPYEGLKTLRIIVTKGSVSGGDLRIIYNDKISDIGTAAGTPVLDHGTVTVPDIPVGSATVYCIGNEESLGKTYDNNTILAELKGNTKLIFVDDPENRHFPKDYAGIEEHGLPISSRATQVEVSQEMKEVDIDLERAVVKFNITVENATGSSLSIDSFSFGPFSGDSFYMFPTYQLDIPATTGYEGFSFSPSLSAESMKDSEPYVFYIYPTYAYQGDGDSPFTIAMSAAVDGKTIDYEARRFTTKNSFRRNTQVNIRARITSTTNVTLDFNVSDWDTYTVNVPDFN